MWSLKVVRGETHAYRRTTEQTVGVDSCGGLVVVDAFMVEFYVQTRVQCVWSKGWPVHGVRSCGARLAGLGWYRVDAQGDRVPLLDPGQRACLLYLHYGPAQTRIPPSMHAPSGTEPQFHPPVSYATSPLFRNEAEG